MANDKPNTKKQYTVHLIGNERVFTFAASSFNVNKDKGTIEFTDAGEQHKGVAIFFHAVAYIEETAIVDVSKLPKKYGERRS
jgi:hypothetical protein